MVLPGIGGFLGAEAAFGLVQVGSGLSGTSAAITLTGAQEGDFVIAVVGSNESGPVSAPSGWTSIYVADVSGNITMIVIGKLLESGETTIPTSTGRQRIAAAIFRPNRPIAGFTGVSFGHQGTSGNPSARTVNASGGTAPLIVVGAAHGLDGAVNFDTASPAFDVTATPSSSGADVILGCKLYNSSPANHTIDVNDSGAATTFATGYVQVSE